MSKKWLAFAWCALVAMWASSIVLGLQLYRSISEVGRQVGIAASRIEQISEQQGQPMQVTTWRAEATAEEIRSPKRPDQDVKPWLDEHFLRVHQAQAYRPTKQEK